MSTWTWIPCSGVRCHQPPLPPLFPENRELICKESIAKMKDGVILLNTARGALIVGRMADALNSGKIYAAGLDVAAVEPLPASSPLLGTKSP